ncbi:MAG: tyrosine--tRNA ligase [Planctomycetota bacterium]
MPTTTDFLDELTWRGLIKDCTDVDGLRRHLGAGKRLAYCGFDPTADSLTIGNLVPIMILRRWQQAGDVPVVVMGGGTGLIGDPSGKSAERQLMTAETVEENIRGQRPIFDALLKPGAGEAEPIIVNNHEWLGSLGYLEVLRDVGKHFSVNVMMQKDSVRERLMGREQGISYTEFSYMILQAYDFLRLHDDRGVSVQLGGSDQYGNIVAGNELIRRTHVEPGSEDAGPEVFGLTTPLITKADGGKFGKTESGAVWLTADRTSPYAYYQFWLNAADADVEKFLKTFTLLTEPEIAKLMADQADAPGKRPAQRALAREATTLLHGAEAAAQAELAGRALFSGELAALPEALLAEVMSAVPSSDHAKSSLEGDGADAVELLVEVGLAKSKREAREFIGNGSVTVFGEGTGRKLGEGEAITPGDLLHGSMIAIRRGKKAWHLTRWA